MKIGGCIVALVLCILIELGIAWVGQLLWNALVPSVFHGPHLTYLQAVLALALLSIIAGAFKSANGGGKS